MAIWILFSLPIHSLPPPPFFYALRPTQHIHDILKFRKQPLSFYSTLVMVMITHSDMFRVTSPY